MELLLQDFNQGLVAQLTQAFFHGFLIKPKQQIQPWKIKVSPVAFLPGDQLLDPETGRNLATGEIFTATRAKKYGLVDEIGFLEDAIDRAIELAGLQPGDEIVEVAGKRYNLDFSDIALAAALSRDGQEVSLKVRRNGVEKEFKLVATRRNGAQLKSFGIIRPCH